MKLWKLFAWMMTLAMLFGMIPAAQAQTIWCPDMGWEHDWSTPEYDYGTCDWGFKYCKRCGAGSEVPPQHKWVTQTIEQPDCTEPGWKESLCANCGDEKGDRQEIPALGHNWGSWRWTHGEPPCNSRGAWQVRDCQRCGQQKDRWIEGGAHAFGPWYSTQEPTCMAPGRQEHTCTLCGHTEWTTIPQMDHVFGEWRVIEEPQVGIPGTERRACTYHCGTHEDREIPPLTAALGAGGLLRDNPLAELVAGLVDVAVFLRAAALAVTNLPGAGGAVSRIAVHPVPAAPVVAQRLQGRAVVLPLPADGADHGLHAADFAPGLFDDRFTPFVAERDFIACAADGAEVQAPAGSINGLRRAPLVLPAHIRAPDGLRLCRGDHAKQHDHSHQQRKQFPCRLHVYTLHTYVLRFYSLSVPS